MNNWYMFLLRSASGRRESIPFEHGQESSYDWGMFPEPLSVFLAIAAPHWLGPYGAGAIISFIGLVMAFLPANWVPALVALEQSRALVKKNRRAFGVAIFALVLLWASYGAFCDVYKPEPKVYISNFSREKLLDRTRLPYQNYAILMEVRTDKAISDAVIEIYSIKDSSGQEIDGVHFPLCRYTFGKHSGGCFSSETIVGVQNYPILILDSARKHLSFVTDGDEPEHIPIKDLRPGLYFIDLVVRSESFVNGARFIGQLRWTGSIDDLSLVWSKVAWPKMPSN